MSYIINHFLQHNAHAASSGEVQFEHFTFNHVCNGDIEAQGEDPDDRWLLRVRNNIVTVHDGILTYEGIEEA
jgi:hypothetical protein